MSHVTCPSVLTHVQSNMYKYQSSSSPSVAQEVTLLALHSRLFARSSGQLLQSPEVQGTKQNHDYS